MVDGRGACRLPDGVNRFVTSALDVFSDHLPDIAAAAVATPTPPRCSPFPDAGVWR
jgi:hypothetical protein